MALVSLFQPLTDVRLLPSKHLETKTMHVLQRKAKHRYKILTEY